MGTINERMQAAGKIDALKQLAQLLTTVKRREQARNRKRKQRARERTHRSWVSVTGLRADGHVIRPCSW